MAPVHGDTVWRLLTVCMIVIVILLVRGECVCTYSREDLLHILATTDREYKPSFFFSPDISTNIQSELLNSPPGPDHADSNHRRMKRKRGKRSGVLVRFRQRAHRPPLPAIVLSNVHSLNNKTDELFHLVSSKREFRDASVLCLTETWLKPEKPDSIVTPKGFTIHRGDRNLVLAEKEDGGGVCFMINDRWCKDTSVFSQSCSPVLEHLTINCRPFYSPREFASVVLIAVYIPPKAKATAAIGELTKHVAAAESAFPESTVIVLGDFNHTSLRKTMPRYYQHVDCATCGMNTLDLCYTTLKHAYRATPRAPLGNSDHVMVLLTPTYRQKLKAIKTVTRTVRKWTPESSETLKGCLEATDWDVFKEACSSLDEYTDTVTSYIAFCEEMCIPSKNVRIYGNDKAWFNETVKKKLNEKNEAFKSGDKDKYRMAKAEVRREIHRAKGTYKQKLEKQFSSSNMHQVWQGLQQITCYKKKTETTDDADPDLSNKLNNFYSRFDQSNPSPGLRPALPEDPSLLTPPFIIEETEVRNMFKKQNPRKASGPDKVSTSVLRSCADQLAPIFAHIFNLSLQQLSVPRCFKSSVIVPVPKKAKITQLNDFRPVALTSVAMKVFERLILQYLKSVVGHLLDPLQFAYQANRSVDDAVALAVHYILQHLERPRTYCRVLFIDYSSAFNTIIPHKLFHKLSLLNVHPSICHWILDFLLDRPQVVKVNNVLSTSLTLNTGAPQGCVLSPLLFTLFTNDCRSTDSSVHVLKFSDDTTIVGLVSDANENAYRQEVKRVVDWCSDNDLELNVSKTKEMIVDFRVKKNPLTPLEINGEVVEQVPAFKFLGTMISNDLSWDVNSTAIVKKCQQRLHFLRQLKKLRLNMNLLVQFYRAVIESILCFSITVWYSGTSESARNQLERIVKTASNITGYSLPSVYSLFQTRSTKKVKNILSDESHPANHIFKLLPSGRRFQALKTRTSRFRNSFFPEAVLNMSDNIL